MSGRVAWALALLAVVGAVSCAAPADTADAYIVDGDAIPRPLTAVAGDAGRGRSIVTGREANCLFCHAVPEPGLRFMGDVGPPLASVGKRLTAAQMRLRLVDPARVNRDAAMPAYHRTEGLNAVAEAYRGKPILTAQEIEDVIAYLRTLH